MTEPAPSLSGSQGLQFVDFMALSFPYPPATPQELGRNVFSPQCLNFFPTYEGWDGRLTLLLK